MAAQKYLLEAECGENNGNIKFTDADKIEQFINDEFGFWQWLNQPPVQGQLGNNAWNTIHGKIQQVRNQLPQLKANPEGQAAAFKGIFEQAFKNSRIPVSTSPVASFITDLRDDDPIAAGAALTIWMNLTGVQMHLFNQMKGVMLMAAFDAKITTKTPAAISRSLKKLDQSFQDGRAESQAEAETQSEAFELARVSQRKTMAAMLWGVRKKYNSFRNTKTGEVNAAITSLQETEALYKEHMRLKGPVDYWSAKSTGHGVKAKTYRNTLAVYGGVAGVALVLALFLLAGHAIEVASTDKPPAIYLILTTLGVVVTTIVFWIARVLTRLFLSEHHLAIDAEERAIMAQTYLALTAEGQATEQERAIVLTSLFRPTADGIVKDDAAPDFSPAAILSKLGSK